jgi:flavin reductase (DIM6/NTAB) family NADH-FMN oxidoreductase RutF
MPEASADAFVMDFKESMARVSSTVVVVTTMTQAGPHGTTVSAFMSLSVNPPMIVVSLDCASELLARIRGVNRFGVNVLSHDQADIARSFARKARKGSEKFVGVRWALDHGMPRLDGTASWLSCWAARLVEGGDHVLVIGVVEAAEVADGLPLTYHARSFGTHAPLTAPSQSGGPR